MPCHSIDAHLGLVATCADEQLAIAADSGSPACEEHLQLAAGPIRQLGLKRLRHADAAAGAAFVAPRWRLMRCVEPPKGVVRWRAPAPAWECGVFLARPLRVAADVAQPQQHHGLVAPFGSAKQFTQCGCSLIPFRHSEFMQGAPLCTLPI